jgi:hypothetical protein
MPNSVYSLHRRKVALRISRNFHPPIENAFTLMELLISIAVLALITILIAQLINSVASATTTIRKRLDPDGHARMIFDRMATDFGNMVKRPDADCFFAKLASGGNTGMNDAMFFYSFGPAYFNSIVAANSRSSVALVGYRINFNNPDFPNVPILERLGKGLSWDGQTAPPAPGGMMFLTTLPGTATPLTASTITGNWQNLGTLTGKNNSAYADGSDSDYYVLSNQVYRLEVAFQLKDSSLSAYPVVFNAPSGWNSGTFYTQSPADPTTAQSSPNYNIGSRWYNTSTKRGYICTNSSAGGATWSPIGVQDVTAVIVAIALLEPTSRKVVPATAYPSLVSALEDVETHLFVGTGQPLLMAQTWNGAILQSMPGVPPTASSQLRIYQRYFYLNP